MHLVIVFVLKGKNKAKYKTEKSSNSVTVSKYTR